MRLVIIMTNDRFIAKLELTISTDRLQDSLWRAVGKGVNCTSCESKECLSYVWSETVVDGRKRGIEWWRQRGRERTVTTSLSAVRAFFVSPTITFHASLWAVPNPPPYSARPHIDTICSWKISIRFTRWRTVATEIKGIVDVFRVSLVSRRCQGICPSLAFDSTKEISCWACCRLRRFCLYNLLFLPLSFGKGKLAKRDGITRPLRPSLGIVSSPMWRLISFENQRRSRWKFTGNVVRTNVYTTSCRCAIFTIL